MLFSLLEPPQLKVTVRMKNILLNYTFLVILNVLHITHPPTPQILLFFIFTAFSLLLYQTTHYFFRNSKQSYQIQTSVLEINVFLLGKVCNTYRNSKLQTQRHKNPDWFLLCYCILHCKWIFRYMLLMYLFFILKLTLYNMFHLMMFQYMHHSLI